MKDVAPRRYRDGKALARRLWEWARGRPRTMVGIAGIPGSGKSTLAEDLCAALDRLAGRPGTAVVVPQDGFHLANLELERRGLAARKGSPDSFAAEAFLAKLSEIRRGSARVRVPAYSRELHEPVPDAIEVGPSAAIVVVEGNYLFCGSGPWRRIKGLFDVRVFVDVDAATAEARVLARHVRGGLAPAAAAAKYERNDRPNSGLVAPTIGVADFIFESTGRRTQAPARPPGRQRLKPRPGGA